MPWAACPACRSDVKYPRDADVGSEVTCPECDEVFVPPKLRPKAKKKAYSVEDEEVYKVGRAADDPEREAKTRKVVAAGRAAVAEERWRNRRKPVSWFHGPEIWLLIFGVGAGGGLPFGIWLARNWERLGNAKLFWILVAMCFLAVIALSLGMSSWAWLRKR